MDTKELYVCIVTPEQAEEMKTNPAFVQSGYAFDKKELDTVKQLLNGAIAVEGNI